MGYHFARPMLHFPSYHAIMQARNLHAKRFHLYAAARILCKVDVRAPTVAHSRRTHSIIMYKERESERREAEWRANKSALLLCFKLTVLRA
jgi:hypothetical protein